MRLALAREEDAAVEVAKAALLSVMRTG